MKIDFIIAHKQVFWKHASRGFNWLNEFEWIRGQRFWEVFFFNDVKVVIEGVVMIALR